MEQWFANFNQGAKCVLVTVGFHWTLQRERVLLYLASLHFYTSIACRNNVVSSCVVIGCPTLLTIALQGQAEYSTVTHPSWRRMGLVHETAAAGAPLTPL